MTTAVAATYSVYSLPGYTFYAMTMLQIPVPESTAQRFSELSAQQQTQLSQLIVTCLSEPTCLLSAMDYISFKANQRGLEADIVSGDNSKKSVL